MLNEDAGPDELESIAVAIHTLVGLPTTIRSLKRKGLRLEKGKIIESGSHAELISNETGLYRYLSGLQFEIG